MQDEHLKNEQENSSKLQLGAKEKEVPANQTHNKQDTVIEKLAYVGILKPMDASHLPGYSHSQNIGGDSDRNKKEQNIMKDEQKAEAMSLESKDESKDIVKNERI